jgi:hypothetical protein
MVIVRIVLAKNYEITLRGRGQPSGLAAGGGRTAPPETGRVDQMRDPAVHERARRR